MLVDNLKLGLVYSHPLAGTINSAEPTVSWRILGDERNWVQSTYQIKIRYEGSSEYTEYPEIKSSESQFVSWPGRPLRSKEELDICVRVKGQEGGHEGEYSAWSDTSTFHVGVLDEWSAPFIALEDQPRVDEPTAPETLFRKTFTSKQVSKAKLWGTAAGIYEVEINGQRVANDYLRPGFTSYEKRLLHQMYDVSGLVVEGENVISARVAPGWYSGKFGFDGGMVNIYGDKRAVSLQLDLVHEDGLNESITTDQSWRACLGPIVRAGLYDGEYYDANLEVANWSSVGPIDESQWKGVEVVTMATEIILPQAFPSVTPQRKIQPIEVITTPSGKKVVDFGENVVGFVEFCDVSAPQNYEISFVHAEVMENGELGTRPLREAKATDVYVFKGALGESYRPRFTFHGFRYCQINDPDSLLDPRELKAVVISTNMEQVGDFECDNELLNKLHSNVIRSTRGNFLTLPTDCPQRDERMGWTGDIALFGQTATFLFDCSSMLSNWLQDHWAEQQLRSDRRFAFSPPVTVPDVVKYMKHLWDSQISAIWGDCAVILPKKLYDSTGCVDILAQQYESMEKWIECIPKLEGKLRWDNSKIEMQLGDWLDPTAPPDDPIRAMTDSGLVADAFLYLVLTYMVEVSALVKPADAARYSNMQKDCKRDFQAAYMKDAGGLTSHTQTAYSLAICFGLYSNSEQIKFAGEQLALVVLQNDYKIATGFAGTPFVTQALAKTGHLGTAYSMLLQTKCPSWLYPVTMGATTVWERWDSMLEDGSINPGSMTSFNHYALGAVASTLHEVIGGLNIASRGYRTFTIAPQPGGGLSRCSVWHESPYGKIESAWTIEGNEFTLSSLVPLNTSAVVSLPDGTEHEVGSGRYRFSCSLPQLASK